MFMCSLMAELFCCFSPNMQNAFGETIGSDIDSIGYDEVCRSGHALHILI